MAVNQSCWKSAPIWSLFLVMLFSVCFQSTKKKKKKSVFIHQQSVRDLNKSWFLSFGSGAIWATGLWRPLNYSSQTDDWLLIHPFFWKGCLIIIPISTRPARKLQSQAVKIFCTPASQACQIKRACQWHFEDGSPKTEKRKKKEKDELCKISLNIALQRRVSHMPTVSSLRQDINWNTAHSGTIQRR